MSLMPVYRRYPLVRFAAGEDGLVLNGIELKILFEA